MIFEPAPDEKEDDHNGVYLVIQKRYALQVERPDTVQTWHWGDGRLEGRPPKVRNLFRHVQLAQIQKVAFAQRPRDSVLHPWGSEVSSVGEVFVRGPGGGRWRNRRSCDGPDRGRQHPIERGDGS
jgi:hypothetical protein